MRLLFEIDTKNYSDTDEVIIRPSSRSIIIEKQKILMVYSIEEGETSIEAVIRETYEEAGLIIKKENLKEFGIVKRTEKINNKVFYQDNYYYLVNKYDKGQSQQLDDYEYEEGYTLVLVDPATAIKTNINSNHGSANQIMLIREAKVLEILIKEGYFK